MFSIEIECWRCRYLPEYAVDDEVDTAVDRDQKVVGLGELVVSLVQVLSTSIIWIIYRIWYVLPTSSMLTTRASRLQTKKTATTQKSMVARPCSRAWLLTTQWLDTSGRDNFNRITLRRILKAKARGPWIHVDNAMDQCSAVFPTVNSVNTWDAAYIEINVLFKLSRQGPSQLECNNHNIVIVIPD